MLKVDCYLLFRKVLKKSHYGLSLLMFLFPEVSFFSALFVKGLLHCMQATYFKTRRKYYLNAKYLHPDIIIMIVSYGSLQRYLRFFMG